MTCCVEKSPAQRATIKELLKHGFIKQHLKDSLEKTALEGTNLDHDKINLRKFQVASVIN